MDGGTSGHGLERRALLRLGAAAGAAALGACRAPETPDERAPDPALATLAGAALDEARRLGASYADCRLVDTRRQELAVRERRVSAVRETEERGFGVRVLVDGCFGFAASARVAPEELARCARRAVELARAAAGLQHEPVRLSAPERHVAVWETPVRRDPFAVPLADKLARLLALDEAALAHAGVSFVNAAFEFVREHKYFASTDGGSIEQTLVRTNPSLTLTHVDRERARFESRDAFCAARGEGYECIEGFAWEAEIERAAAQVVEKARAPSVTPGEKTLILHPTNLWLVIHESIGHSTEYDRALGLEANYAGTSFLTPDKLGHFQLASERVTFEAEKTAPGSLATAGYDDEGIATRRWLLVERGLFVDYQLTRAQAPLLGRRAQGCALAQSWRDVPFQRMPNVNLLPGADGLSLEELIADTDDGILIHGRGSYSIDHQRQNFQFGGQTFHAIRKGRVAGMLRDVAYQARTSDFWRSCDAVCGPGEYWVGGSFQDGKGEPIQVNAVSHGCSAARFRGIDVLNTSRAG